MSTEAKLNPFLEISHRLATCRQIEEICRTVAGGLMTTEVDRCSVVIGVEYKGDLLTVGEAMAVEDVRSEMRDAHLHTQHKTADHSAIEQLVRERQPILIADVEANEKDKLALLDADTHSAILCPMVSQDQVTGYILAEKRDQQGFVEDDLALYQATANHAAAAVEAARSTDDLEQQIQQCTREVARFKGLAENALDGVCMATLGSHRLLYANPAYYTMHGYDSRDELIGTVDESFALYEESQSSMTTQITRLGGLRREYVHTRKDESTFVGLDTVFAVRDQEGEVVALGNIIRDITQQKEMEKRLRELSDLRHWQFEVITEIAQDISTAPEMEELFRRVVSLVKERFDFYHTHVYLLNEAGDTLEMMEGYGEPGRIMKERGHSIPIGKGLVGTAARTEQPVLAPNVRKRKDWLPNDLLPDTKSELAVPIKMGDKVLGVLDVQSDRLNGVTEEAQTLLLGLCGQIAVAIENARILSSVQKLVEERTQEVAIFQALAQNATYGLWMSTPEGVISYANRASHEMFGYRYHEEKSEMIGMFVNQFFVPEMSPQFEKQLPTLSAGGSWQGELDGIRKDGTSFTLQVVAFGILGEYGTPLAVAAINRDITEQKQLEADKEELNQRMLDAHRRLIRDLSAPLIPITENILVLPLIGTIDSVRAQQIMESLLQGVENYDAEVVIIDITGVPVLDTSVANHLVQMTNAAALLGAKTVLVGIMPSVAQTLVELGVDLSSIITRNNLQGGVAFALRAQGLHITPLQKQPLI